MRLFTCSPLIIFLHFYGLVHHMHTNANTLSLRQRLNFIHLYKAIPKKSIIGYGRTLWSFKIIETATNWKPAWDFLILFYHDCMPICYQFQDTMIQWSKISRFTHRSLVWSPRTGVPSVWKLVSKNKSPWSTRRWNCITIWLLVFNQHQHVTDK